MKLVCVVLRLNATNAACRLENILMWASNEDVWEWAAENYKPVLLWWSVNTSNVMVNVKTI